MKLIEVREEVIKILASRLLGRAEDVFEERKWLASLGVEIPEPWRWLVQHYCAKQAGDHCATCGGTWQADGSLLLDEMNPKIVEYRPEHNALFALKKPTNG